MALTQIKPAGLSKPIDLGDNEKLRLGASNDLELYYDGTDTRIQHVGFSGQLELYANNFEIAKQTNASKYIRGNNGVLELYYDNNKKLETTSSGVSITGGITADGASEFTANVKFDGATAGRDITFLRSSNTLRFQDNTILSLGDGDDFKMFHNGTITRFVHDLAGANLEFQSDNFVFKDKDNGDVMMKLLHDGAVELYHDGSKKFETTSIGASITGNLSFPDNGYAMFGAGNDLQIYHSGTDTFFKNQTGSLNFFNSGVTQFRNAADNESLLKMTSDGDVELYYDGVKKFETTSGGVEVFGVLQMDDGNSHIKLIDGARIDIGSSADLQIFHSGGENFIRGNASASTLFIDCCNELQIRHLDTNGANSEKMIVCNDDGAVELYHDGTKTVETFEFGLDLLNATGNIGFRWGGANFNYCNIWAEYGSGDLFLAGGLKPKTTNSGFFSSYGNSAFSRNAIQIDAFGNEGIHFYASGTQTVATDSAITVPEKVRINQHGLTFNGDSAAANALDDYEEGTWTPVANISGVSSVSGVECFYTKVGRMVHITARFTMGSGGSSNLTIGGLPFTSKSNNQISTCVMHNGFDEGGSQEPVLMVYFGSSTTNMEWYYTRTNGANWVRVIGTEAQNHEVIFTFSYVAA